MESLSIKIVKTNFQTKLNMLIKLNGFPYELFFIFPYVFVNFVQFPIGFLDYFLFSNYFINIYRFFHYYSQFFKEFSFKFF